MVRRFILLLSLVLLLCACATGTEPAQKEHSAEAAMANALSVTLYLPDGNGGLTAEEKRLPWEQNMAFYALSFLPEAYIGHCTCRVERGDVRLDLAAFPSFESAAEERCAVASIVNTLLQLPDVDSVQLLFNGKTLPALAHGTAVNESFHTPVDVSGGASSE